MTNSGKAIYVLAALIGVVFIVMLIALSPEETIVFTDDEDAPITAPELTGNNPTIGSNAPGVVIVVYGHFLCDSCADIAASLQRLMLDFPDDLAIVWKDLPNATLEPESVNAAIAARCAQKQNAFWEYSDYLFANRYDAGEELYFQVADELNLWQWRFERCYNKQNTMDLVEADYAEAQDLGIAAPPTLYINSERYSGSMAESEIRSVIITLLNR